MKKLVAGLSALMAGVLSTNADASVRHYNEVFKETVDVPRIYSAYLKLDGCGPFEISTENQTTGSDPVVFLQRPDGSQIDMDDDSGSGTNSRLSYRPAACSTASTARPASLGSVQIIQPVMGDLQPVVGIGRYVGYNNHAR